MSPGIVAESDLSGNLKSEYVFFERQRVARKDFSGSTTSAAYYFSDSLRTASVVIDSGGKILSESDYYPWGGELQLANSDANHYKFTGKERDGETGLDYFGARYYGNWVGRFLTPDWAAKAAAIPYAQLDDPQSLNLYSYVRNRPTFVADLDGHDVGDGSQVTTTTTTSGPQTFTTSANGNTVTVTYTVTTTTTTVQDQQGNVVSANVTSTMSGTVTVSNSKGQEIGQGTFKDQLLSSTDIKAGKDGRVATNVNGGGWRNQPIGSTVEGIAETVATIAHAPSSLISNCGKVAGKWLNKTGVTNGDVLSWMNKWLNPFSMWHAMQPASEMPHCPPMCW